MPISDDEIISLREAEKRKEEEKTNAEEEGRKKANSLETVVLELLQSKINDRQHWLNYQDISSGFQNKFIRINYSDKPDKFRTDLVNALRRLEREGKIKKQSVVKEEYYSAV